MSALGRAFGTTRRCLGAVVYAYALRLLCAWILASPIARALTAPVASRHPRGDAILFDPGGLELLESLRLSFGVLASEARGAMLVGSVLGWLALIPAAGLLVALDERERSGPAEWTRRGIELLPRFTLTFGSRLFCQGVVAVLAAVGLSALDRRLSSLWDERRTDLTLLSLALPVLAVLVLFGVFEDLVRVELVRGARVFEAVRRAWTRLARQVWALSGGWLLIGACSLALPLLAAPLVGRLDVSRPEAWRVVAVTLLHQAVVFSLVGLRALWLALLLAERSAESAPRAERLAVDLQVAAGGSVPADVQAHDPAPEPRQ